MQKLTAFDMREAILIVLICVSVFACLVLI